MLSTAPGDFTAPHRDGYDQSTLAWSMQDRAEKRAVRISWVGISLAKESVLDIKNVGREGAWWIEGRKGR
jgi:hypothetical protein